MPYNPKKTLHSIVPRFTLNNMSWTLDGPENDGFRTPEGKLFGGSLKRIHMSLDRVRPKVLRRFKAKVSKGTA